MKRFAILFLVASTAHAQPQPGDQPAGPADIINGAREARDQAEQERSLEGPQDQAPQQAPQQAQQPEVAPEVVRRANGRTPPLAISEPDNRVPRGTIRVIVVDAQNNPVSGADIRIGIMKSDSSRDSIMGRTNTAGILDQAELPTGSSQAYRVNVHYDGATYSSTPFRLEPDRGQLVRVRRLETTRDTRALLQSLGQTMLEYKQGRVKVTQQAQLMNLGDETVVLDADSIRFDLPEDFTAFQTPQSMDDQRLVPDDDGFVVRGSVPPGRVALVWSYDLPLSGDEISFSTNMPFRTYGYRVMTDAADGMRLEVDGFPRAEEHEGHGGRRLLVTQIERGPEDDDLDRLRITVRGIPGSGPARWLALGGAMVLLIFGFLLATRGGDRAGAITRARRARQDELLEDAAELEKLFQASEIGPKFRERRMAEIVDELASLIRLDEATKASLASRAPKKKKAKKKPSKRA